MNENKPDIELEIETETETNKYSTTLYVNPTKFLGGVAGSIVANLATRSVTGFLAGVVASAYNASSVEPRGPEEESESVEDFAQGVLVGAMTSGLTGLVVNSVCDPVDSDDAINMH